MLTRTNKGNATGHGLIDTIPSLAKGTASVKLSGRAEKAIIAELKGLEPKIYGKAVCRHKMPPQGKAGHEVEI